MGASIGPRLDVGLFDSPRPDLLQQVTGIRPEAPSGHVLLVDAGFKSVQRLVVADWNGGLVAGVWPAELKAHARYIYSDGRAARFVTAAPDAGWWVAPNPHIAFWQAPPFQRLYLEPESSLELTHYVELWEGPGWEQIGGHSRESVRGSLWPWLKEHGCATNSDDARLEEFLMILANRRQVHLRAGLHARRVWPRADIETLSASLASTIREEVNKLLGAVGEPRLPIG